MIDFNLKKFDLHVHSIESDGTDNAENLIEKIKASGIKLFSVTDHDTLNFAKNISLSKLPSDIKYINGVEFTGIYNCINVHLLVYGYNIDSYEINAVANLAGQKRKIKCAAMRERLSEKFGIFLPDDTYKILENTNSVGKPHFAVELIKQGYGSDVGEVINKYFGDMHTEIYRLDAAEVISAAHKSGGLVFLAHPKEIMDEYSFDYNQIAELISNLKSIGIDGIEVYHTKHTKEDSQIFTQIANNNSLLSCGGSDYHGTNKKVSLGTLWKGDKPKKIIINFNI